jgi:hypothetical protein
MKDMDLEVGVIIFICILELFFIFFHEFILTKYRSFNKGMVGKGGDISIIRYRMV